MEINSLQKTTQEKSSSINNLTAEKEKLGKLVAELDSTVHSYSQLSNQLRERICISEDYALQKDIQYKQLEMDYYDTVYQRLP
jgi:chromosome segregation ATPase